MKKTILLSIFVIAIFISSCADDNSVNNYNGGNTDVYIEILNLHPGAWIVNPDYNFQWYQEFVLTNYSQSLSDEGTIIAYMKNQYGAWESLPYTTVLWTEDSEQIVYSEEMWYSYTNDRFFVDYRNTHPYSPSAPTTDIQIKLVIIENWLLASITQNTDISNHDNLIQALNLHSENENVHSITIE